MKDDLREVVAHTILTEILRQDSTSPAKMNRDLLWPWLDQGEVDFGAVADAAIAAARPVIGEECAKVAEGFDAPHLNGVGQRIASAIRSATQNAHKPLDT